MTPRDHLQTESFAIDWQVLIHVTRKSNKPRDELLHGFMAMAFWSVMALVENKMVCWQHG